MEQLKNSQLLVPLAILVAGGLVASAIIFVNLGGSDTQQATVKVAEENLAGEIVPVHVKDHMLGNFNTAEVFVVEFSDLECPFCKVFHATLQQIIKQYGDSGKVAWVYRHFPLENLHPKAFKESEATECAAELGGEKAFWAYTNRLFEITPSNNGLDLALLPTIATEVGLDQKAFSTCLESGRHAEKVRKDLNDALNSGGRGTPHTIVITKDGKKTVAIQGAQSFEFVSATIEKLLK